MTANEQLTSLFMPIQECLRKIDHLSLPSKAIDCSDFHLSLPQTSGIYYVIHAENVLYIGQTNNLRRRWREHHCKSKALKFGHVRLHYLKVSQNLPTIEDMLIKQLRPFWNQGNNPGYDPNHPYCNLPLCSINQASLEVYSGIQEGMITISQAAKLAGVGIGTIHRWIKQKQKTKSIKADTSNKGKYLVNQASLEAHLKKRQLDKSK